MKDIKGYKNGRKGVRQLFLRKRVGGRKRGVK
jgi:hypothetical protein